MISQQRTHHSTTNRVRKGELVVMCDQVQSPSNIGSLFRICDAFGVSEIIFNTTDINFDSSRLRKTSRNTHKTVSYRITEDLLSEINDYQKKGFQTIALEITENSTPIQECVLEENKKLVLLIGNEQQGISNEMLYQVQKIVHIPMFGTNSSMNVIQATAIALYALTKL